MFVSYQILAVRPFCVPYPAVHGGNYSPVVTPLLSLSAHTHTHTRTHARTFNGPLSGTTQVSRCQKGKTDLDFTEARDSEWQWHQLAKCKSAPRSRQITMPALHHSVFLQAGCPSCRATNSVKALKAFKLISRSTF